ncbi:hypothetical protein IV203_028941 [Nitzschia inconspicua]|uniref:Uncharacterized protein n=1 Tax=Nitzschia inconspicua TaxID=303405 RepID=A0A9K3LTE5_9STRA|nr:hypothetical protein IV203_028941 [Nitzschia inconspicua]
MRLGGLALIKTYKQEQSTVLEGLLQEFHGGSALYYEVQAELDNSTDLDANIGGNPGWSMYENIFHDLFRSLFQPSEPIAKLLRRKMEMTNLTAGQYVSCHHRAFYAVEDQKHKRNTQELRNQALNAVNCASMIMPGAPIYFASDSKESLQAVQNAAARHHRPIVTIDEDAEEALHLDKAVNWTTLDPSKFYPTFVDLLLMGNARCTAYGVGGFGRFGALLSYNSTCIIRHVRRPKNETCHWTDTVTTTQMANI